MHGYTIISLILYIFINAMRIISCDDQFNCCMGGPKRVDTLEICSASCCRGYHEQHAQVPQLGKLYWCERDKPLYLMNDVKRFLYKTK